MKILKNYIALSLYALVLGGCTSYPEQGTGGLAESYDSINYQNSDFSPVMPDEPLGPEHGLRFDWQLAKLHLDALIQEGARWCFPAAVVQAIEKQNRIARELQGGLLLDAANDLVIQRKRLNELEVQLDYVTSQARCEPPKNETQFRMQLSVIEQLYDLLNVDNQFAEDSIEVNPKYMGRLAEATSLLKEHKSLDLVVTGHADATGTEEYNDKLALGRAKQVERYLTIFGLGAQRIKAVSVGETVPLFEGESDGTRLTNRRVSIEVISPKNAEKMGGGL
ncbi:MULTISPECIES: OmpA family protein [Vibrio]|uniref:OmpA family protein n=1 Tax=Vibrio TaxID=662 RepID=UPI0006348064|nr:MULTISPECIES: OmpA family protein [Vibrio]MCK8080378.1 OmpA family protein [Vibrio sp. 1CM24A]CDT05468.1 putative Outer membrane protein SypB [Vibrio coralliirubri]CDT50462.1 putative Outer membrane protein SypB [Vibrio coralliirubri]CDT67422.1 putative Outer membrane protein SypB [Vibrio coralliirubri]CDT85432.1 putative Outer membrane protein SypB [Vibrio coralliirubri]